MCAAGLGRARTGRGAGVPEIGAENGLYLESELQRLSARHGLGEVRGRGLLLALDLRVPIAPLIVAAALDDGVLLNAPRPDSSEFMPALNVTRKEIDLMIRCLDVC